MSDLTSCCHCSLMRIRRQAKEEGKRVTVLGDAKWGLGGVNVYVHPPEINIRKLGGGEDGPRAKWRAAWMMELTQHCAC